jgi:hypothetical protein
MVIGREDKTGNKAYRFQGANKAFSLIQLAYARSEDWPDRVCDTVGGNSIEYPGERDWAGHLV